MEQMQGLTNEQSTGRKLRRIEASVRWVKVLAATSWLAFVLAWAFAGEEGLTLALYLLLPCLILPVLLAQLLRLRDRVRRDESYAPSAKGRAVRAWVGACCMALLVARHWPATMRDLLDEWFGWVALVLMLYSAIRFSVEAAGETSGGREVATQYFGQAGGSRAVSRCVRFWSGPPLDSRSVRRRDRQLEAR